MNVAGFAGFSGSGKTTLVEQLIAALRQRGQRVSVVKHAHHRFDIDHPGKDSFRHRQAGAFEVVVASSQRLALIREFEQPEELSVHRLLAQLDSRVDWALVEGLKESDVPKIEVWRASTDQRPARRALYGDDGFVVAVATDNARLLPLTTQLPVLDLNNPSAIADWMLANRGLFVYDRQSHGEFLTCERP